MATLAHKLYLCSDLPPASMASAFLTNTKLHELTGGKTQEVVTLTEDTSVDVALRVRVAPWRCPLRCRDAGGASAAACCGDVDCQ